MYTDLTYSYCYSTRIISQYSLVGMPDHNSPPAVAGEDNVQTHNYQEIRAAANNRESVQYDYLVKPPVDRSCYTPPAEYQTVVDTKREKRPELPVVIDPSCAASGPGLCIIYNTADCT